jgi:hypothetical protein
MEDKGILTRTTFDQKFVLKTMKEAKNIGAPDVSG